MFSGFEKLDSAKRNLGSIRKATLGEAMVKSACFETHHWGILYDIL